MSESGTCILFEMSQAPNDKDEEKPKFGFQWILGTIVSGTFGLYLVMYLSFSLNPEPSGLVVRFFASHILVNSFISGAVCVSLFQGWLLASKGISFRGWIVASVLGYGGGLLLVYLTAHYFPGYGFFSSLFALPCTTVLQARQLRGHVEIPYAWPVFLTFMMVAVNNPLTYILVGFFLASAFDSVLVQWFAISALESMAFALATAFSLYNTKPKFETNLRFKLATPNKLE